MLTLSGVQYSTPKHMRARAIDNLFARFERYLARSGYLAKGGQIIDATIIQAPKQHNNQDEKEAIKAGEIPEELRVRPARQMQKDRDARWTVKYSKAKQPTETPISALTGNTILPFRRLVTRTMPAVIERRGQTVTTATARYGLQLKNVLARDNTASTVWADSAC